MDSLGLPESWLPERDLWRTLSHKHARLPSTVLLTLALTVGMLHRSVFLAHRVFAGSFPVYSSVRPEDARMLRKKYRAKDRAKWAPT